jgi:hypothetical protein
MNATKDDGAQKDPELSKEDENQAMIERIKQDLDMYTKKYEIDQNSER